MDLIKNPIVKIIGIIIILYFALFANTHEPDSLGNRLSKERIGDNLKKAKMNTIHIKSTINQKKSVDKNIENNNQDDI